MTYTCACWHCRGLAWNDGSMHTTTYMTGAELPSTTYGPLSSSTWNPDPLLLSQRDHYLAGCGCPQRRWCVPHGFAGTTWEHHRICADHGHVDPNPDPLRAPGTDTDPGPPKTRKPGLCPHGAPLGRCWCPGPECAIPEPIDDDGHPEAVIAWIAIAALAWLVVGVIVWMVWHD